MIEHWCRDNNLHLNPKKSGIVEFQPRQGRTSNYLQIGTCVSGIPVVEKYKYLGVWIDGKLSMEPQIQHIKDKTNFLVHKLWPLLKTVSLDYRINLWKVLVRPMFEMLAGHYFMDNPSNKEKVMNCLKKTFKNFTLLCKNVDDRTVSELMDFQFEKRAAEVWELARIKWEARKAHFPLDYSDVTDGREKLESSDRVFYPRELQKLLNLTTALCPVCCTPCSSSHMLSTHNLYIPNNETLIKRCKELSNDSNNSGLNRRQTLQRIAEYINPFVLCLKDHLM